MFHELIKTKNMHAIMIDNFIFSANADQFKHRIKVRTQLKMETPITYGIALGDKNATKTYKCFQKYVSHNSHQIFEIISEKLVPIKVSFHFYLSRFMNTMNSYINTFYENQHFYGPHEFATTEGRRRCRCSWRCSCRCSSRCPCPCRRRRCRCNSRCRCRRCYFIFMDQIRSHNKDMATPKSTPDLDTPHGAIIMQREQFDSSTFR